MKTWEEEFDNLEIFNHKKNPTGLFGLGDIMKIRQFIKELLKKQNEAKWKRYINNRRNTWT